MTSKIPIQKILLYSGAGYGVGKFIETSDTTVDSAFVSTLTTCLNIFTSARNILNESNNTTSTTSTNDTTTQQLRQLTEAVAKLSQSNNTPPNTVVIRSTQEAASSSALGKYFKAKESVHRVYGKAL